MAPKTGLHLAETHAESPLQKQVNSSHYRAPNYYLVASGTMSNIRIIPAVKRGNSESL
jgi:hypothetical protein